MNIYNLYIRQRIWIDQLHYNPPEEKKNKKNKALPKDEQSACGREKTRNPNQGPSDTAKRKECPEHQIPYFYR